MTHGQQRGFGSSSKPRTITHTVHHGDFAFRAEITCAEYDVIAIDELLDGAWRLRGTARWSGDGIRGFGARLGRGAADTEEILIALDRALTRATISALMHRPPVRADLDGLGCRVGL